MPFYRPLKCGGAPRLTNIRYGGGGSQSISQSIVNCFFLCDVFFNAILLLLLRQRAFISLNDLLACDGCQYKHAMSFIVV